MKVPILKRLISYLYPVRIRVAAGKTTPVLGLYLYQGRWQLGAATALYSDGHHYRPLTTAFSQLRQELHVTKNMLVLGAGLGSAVSVLDHMHCCMPVTLVDIDETIIEWGKKVLPQHLAPVTQWICADARTYVAATPKASWDFLVIDLFQDRIVPAFVSSDHFLAACRSLLRDTGFVVINYIVNNQEHWADAQKQFGKYFRITRITGLGINQVIIGTPLA